MRERLRAIRGADRGFTLTELLIVIVILGVLTGIVVFAVGAFDDRGQDAACKADKKAVEVAVEAFRAQSETGVYPTSMADLVPTYLREIPTDVDFTVAGGVVTVDAITGGKCIGVDGVDVTP